MYLIAIVDRGLINFINFLRTFQLTFHVNEAYQTPRFNFKLNQDFLNHDLR